MKRRLLQESECSIREFRVVSDDGNTDLEVLGKGQTKLVSNRRLFGRRIMYDDDLNSSIPGRSPCLIRMESTRSEGSSTAYASAATQKPSCSCLLSSK
jgi:hypothetical protein